MFVSKEENDMTMRELVDVCWLRHYFRVAMQAGPCVGCPQDYPQIL